MIASSRMGKLIALLLAGGAHGALALALAGGEPVEMEGAAGGAELRLGTGFADLAAGTLTAVQATEPTEPLPSHPAPKAAPSPEALHAQQAEATEAPVPQAQTAEVPPQPDLAAPVPAALTETPPPTQLAALTPPPEALRPAARPEPAEPVKPEPVKAPPPEKQLIEPEPEVRPVARGNAEVNARAGQATGSDRARAITSGTAGKSRSAGNTAASNYPGLILRKLSRVPRPRLSARGAALVSFRVADGGGLAALSIARSSGSAALDRAALRVVQRAAPFPVPPSGARRSFSVQIKGQ